MRRRQQRRRDASAGLGERSWYERRTLELRAGRAGAQHYAYRPGELAALNAMEYPVLWGI